MQRWEYSAWNRRQMLKIAGASGTGIAALTQTGMAEANAASVSVRFNDQRSDGDSVVIASLQTDVEAELLIFESEGDRSMYKRMEIDAGTEFTDRTIDLDNPIPETQLVSISVQPPEGGGSYGGARATVTLGESAYNTSPGVQLIEADPDAGFHHPYFLYTPEAPAGTNSSESPAPQRPLFVELSRRSGPDREARIESARGTINGGVMRRAAQGTNSPALVAALPSSYGGEFMSLGREGLQITEPQRKRIDRQLLAMVADARSRLNGASYTVTDQFHLHGYSSNGRFVDMFTALHPQRVLALSTGGNGVAVLPKAELADNLPTIDDPDMETLPWPIGVADIDELAGIEFNEEAWMNRDQFRYVGADDQWNPDKQDHPREYNHALRYSRLGKDRQELLIDIFGWEQVDQRFQTSRAIYDQLGVPAEFTAYDGMEHIVTKEARRGVIQFHQQKTVQDFEVLSISAEKSTDEVEVGEPVGVTVTARNRTNVAANTTVNLAVERSEVAATDIQVNPHSTETVVLETVFEAPGEYTLTINGVAVGNPIVAVTTETQTGNNDASMTNDPTSPGNETPDSDGESTGEGPGFGIGHAIAALSGIGYLFKHRLSNRE